MEIGFRGWNGSEAGEMCQAFALFYFVEIAGEYAVVQQHDVRIDGTDQSKGQGQSYAPAIFQDVGLTKKPLAEFFRKRHTVLTVSAIAGQHGAVGVHLEIQITGGILFRRETEESLHGGIQIYGITVVKIGAAGIRFLTGHLQQEAGIRQIAQSPAGHRTIISAPVKTVYVESGAAGNVIGGFYGVYIISSGCQIRFS